MKIECIKDNIQRALSKAERISGKNLNLQILNNICIEVKNKEVKIRSTNLDLGIEIIIPAKIHSECIVVVPGKTLSLFLENIKNDTVVSLEKDENVLKIVTKHNSDTLKTYSENEFPTIPLVDGVLAQVSVKDFINGLRSVWFSASSLNIKPELSSVFLCPEKGNLFFVSTDSFRLAEKKIKLKTSDTIPQILIPIKNISEIIRVFEESDGEIKVRIDKNQISFSKDGVYLTSRLVDGTFPDYKQIIPKESLTEIILLKEDLINAMKISQIFSDHFNQVSFLIDPKKKSFELKTKNSEVGESVQSIDAVVRGEPISLNFNYKYIFDAFQSIASDSLSLKMSGAGKPMVIQGVSDQTFTYIVMPMNK
ncbi:MAG: DNA polymerase III subunit beta [Patescibacteria group bacterium]|nr:DNA polymerase III subunit beta [Patescibacteria group bacterium]